MTANSWACSSGSSFSSCSFNRSFRLRFILYCFRGIQSNPAFPRGLVRSLGGRDIHRDLLEAIARVGTGDGRGKQGFHCGLGLSRGSAEIGADDRSKLPEDDNAVVSLLEASPDDFELDLFLLLEGVEVDIPKVEIAWKQGLDGRLLGVNPDLALERDWNPEGLSRVGHTDVRLKLYGVIETALDKVCASQRMFKHHNATVVEIAFGDADALILVTKLSKKASFNVALQKLGLHVDISDESTTFKERIAH